MALTDKQAFKAGFLLKCAEQGLTLEETHLKVKEAIARYGSTKKAVSLASALSPLTWGAGKAMDVGSGALSMLPSLLSTLGVAGIALPALGGAGAGYAAAKLTNPEKDIIDEAKQDELVGEYERLAEEAKRRNKIKQLQRETGRRIIALTPGNS